MRGLFRTDADYLLGSSAYQWFYQMWDCMEVGYHDCLDALS
jgi:hypothetical protein